MRNFATMQDSEEWSALQWAVFNGNETAVRALLSSGAAAPFIEEPPALHDASPKEGAAFKNPQRPSRQPAALTPEEVCVKAEAFDLSPELLVKLGEQQDAEERAAAKRRPKTLSKEERRIAAAASAAAPWRPPDSPSSAPESVLTDPHTQQSEGSSGNHGVDADQQKTPSGGEVSSAEKRAGDEAEASAAEAAAEDDAPASAPPAPLEESTAVSPPKNVIALRHRYTPLWVRQRRAVSQAARRSRAGPPLP